ncbi:hypothetical protein E6C27_scaffold2484G00460 [Cucumis melo var. makuwa]|uniref:DUF4216 domain-containing protein n=1 Tax=Cucumis melo var. makuwa TaxID=1194695 RepID=A0A5A7VJ77_CUCMM|nr:hypothetical protein E6C27_scaffold2484G00460 [Cucumis melo var. makuwa]
MDSRRTQSNFHILVKRRDNLRWIAHGPHPFVIKYNSYAINGCRYHMESYDKNRTVQNSGVSLVAKTICDWVENNSGMKIDDLGFVLVDLKRIGHKSDSFIMATQGRQGFYVKDPSDARWSIVLTPPQRDSEDKSNDDELGDIMIVKEYLVICQILMEDILFNMEPMIVRDDEDKEVGGAEIHGLEKPKQQRKRGPTIMFDVTCVRSEGERKLVEYNEDGVPIGENGAKFNSFIGSCVHYHIPIIYATWIDLLAELKEKIYTIVESSSSVERTHQSRDPEGCTYQSSDPEGYMYQSSDPEGYTYQSSDPEGCTYQSSDPEGCTYKSSDPEGCTYHLSYGSDWKRVARVGQQTEGTHDYENERTVTAVALAGYEVEIGRADVETEWKRRDWWRGDNDEKLHCTAATGQC